MMSFLDSIKICYKKSFTINSRASRSEYWWFILYFYLLIIPSFAFLDTKAAVISIPFMIIWVVSIIPAFTARIRRLHDTGHSGFNILWGCIPYVGCIGEIYLLILECQGSDCFENEYGPCPQDMNLPSDSDELDTQNSFSQTSVSNSQEIAHQTFSGESEEKSKEETPAKVEAVKAPEEAKDWEEI